MFDLSDRERIAVIEKSVTDMNHGLFDNGQPGLIQRMEDRLRLCEIGLVIALIAVFGIKVVEILK